MSEPTKKERVFSEFDDTGMLVKKTIVVDNDQQSSIELNFDKTGKAAAKIKVYDDDPENIDQRIGEYIRIAKKHSGMELPG